MSHNISNKIFSKKDTCRGKKKESNNNFLVKRISKVIQYRGCWQIFYLNIPSATCKFIYHKFLVSVMIYGKICLLGTLLLKRNVV